MSNASAELALDLKTRLARATIVEADRLPKSVITVDSAVVLRDVESGAHHYLLLLLSSGSKRSAADVCVLEPTGLALLGRRIGDVIEGLPASGSRRMRIEAVQQPLALRREDSPMTVGGYSYA